MKTELEDLKKTAAQYRVSQPQEGPQTSADEPLQFSSCYQPALGYNFTGLMSDSASRNNSPIIQRNNTGLPNNLKNGMENISGVKLDHVKVHYNSQKPATVQAHAYAQGSDIHLARGQERHLPHELGHVVQQMQGRVPVTTSVGGVAVNDNPALEHEANRMGTMALQRAQFTSAAQCLPPLGVSSDLDSKKLPIQRVTGIGLAGGIGAGVAIAGAALSAPWVLGGGLLLAGAALGGKLWRGKPETQAPPTHHLSRDQHEELARYRADHEVEPLGVKWDAAFTDEVAGRRRDKNAYRQWQIGRATEEGQPIGKDGHLLPEGRYMYVVTTTHEFRYLPMKDIKGHKEQYRTHSQLAGKQSVYAAGAFDVDREGFIVSIDNESGHYQPPKIQNARYASKLLSFLGVQGEIDTHAHDARQDPKGKAYLKAQAKANARAVRTWLPQKSGTGYRHGFAKPDPELDKEMPF